MPKAKSTRKKTVPKKTGAGKSGTTTKKIARKKAAPKKTRTRKTSARSNLNPVYVLTIMGLLVIILLMVNKLYLGNSPKQNKKNKDVATKIDSEKGIKDKKNSGKTEENDKKENKGLSRQVEAKIFFVRFNSRTDKLYLSPVVRKMNRNNAIINSLKELVRGPAKSEKRKGYLTAIPKKLQIRNIRINNKIAEIDFNSEIEREANGDILLKRIDQIVYTATQFDDVEKVKIKINGRVRSAIGSDGLSINGPIGRKR